jgi:hypothetical protein
MVHNVYHNEGVKTSRETNMATQVIEVLGRGFNAEDDTTDDRVLWVRAESSEAVSEVLRSTGAPYIDLDIIGAKCADDVIDFVLPAESSQLVARLVSFAIADGHAD